MIYLTVFGVMFIAVFLKSWQQKNVIWQNYWLVPPTSVALFGFEMFGIYTVIENFSFLVLFFGGMGAALGCMLAMWSHKKYIKPGWTP